MKRFILTFGPECSEVLAEFSDQYAVFADQDIEENLQNFVSFIPNLAPDEPFYFGFWRVVIRSFENGFFIYEWDYKSNNFVSGINRSLFLWRSQRDVLASEDVLWSSIDQNSVIFATPSTLSMPIAHSVEGVRDLENAPDTSGWFIYCDFDRNNGNDFVKIQLIDLLRNFNVNILRFLCLPDGWKFLINVDNSSSIWKEVDEKKILS